MQKKQNIVKTMPPLKLLYVPESFPQISEIFVINEIWGQLQRGHSVSVVPRVAGDDRAWMHDRARRVRKNITSDDFHEGLDWRSFPAALKRGRQVWGGWRPHAIHQHIKAAMRISNLVCRIKKHPADAIVAHFGYDNAIASAIAAASMNIPFILWLHGSDIHTVPHRHFRWITGKAAKIITNSSFSKQLIQTLGARTPVEVMNIGTDLNLFEPDKAKKNKRPTLICVARLGHSKNHQRLFRVFAKVKKIVPDTTLMLVGGGPDESRLRAYASSLGILENIEFAGQVSRQNLPDWFNKAWLKVLMSDKEGRGICLMEAQACGLPCVASKVGGIPEAVCDGSTGFLIDFDATDGEETAANQIITLIQDQELRERMSNAAVNHAQTQFDEEAFFDRISVVIERVSADHVRKQSTQV